MRRWTGACRRRVPDGRKGGMRFRPAGARWMSTGTASATSPRDGAGDRALRLLADADVPDGVQVVDALHRHGILAVQQLDLAAGTQALEKAQAPDSATSTGGPQIEQPQDRPARGPVTRHAARGSSGRPCVRPTVGDGRRGGDHAPPTSYTCIWTPATIPLRWKRPGGRSRADRALDDPWGVAINQCNLVVALLNAEGPQRAHDELRTVIADAIALDDIGCRSMPSTRPLRSGPGWATRNGPRAVAGNRAATARSDRHSARRTGPETARPLHRTRSAVHGPIPGPKPFDAGLRWASKKLSPRRRRHDPGRSPRCGIPSQHP